MSEKIKEGDRVRHKKHNEKATVDEVYTEDGVEKAAVVWDVSGCIGEGPIDELEKIEK